ncbi:T9SS type A sorting domain-containing protein [Adhaeribacter sp. BT258]|uniref:T9SS type A sorting domain-containing protein n=1 Tax=Adhaeribacter terrigena TaxID=2793070 RepID=A0ABS1C461_9BACT|nr:T9SS type A sorting domain-containing protein [Adhaeribacter terrigena]MBK0403310.1 T9SS type A sorting domain-containing protein [Adhaeribacter terrigena]
MKKLIFMALALAASQGIKAQTYTPVAVTGYNADVVADGTGTVAASTTHDVDGVDFTFMVLGYTNTNTPVETATKGLPVNRLITSAVSATPGLTYELASYTANNALRINGTGTGTLTFPAPAAAEKIYVLATSGSGTSNTMIQVNFSDGTSQIFNQTVTDWYNGTGFAITALGRANRTDNDIDNDASNPRLYQFELALQVGNTTKPIQSITFNNTGSVLNVMGITIKPSAAPATTDAGILAVTAPVSPVMQNSSQAVQATLVNQGTSNLTSATITWKVDGVAQTNFAWTGNLPFNQSTTVTLGNYTFTPGNHTVLARATNPNNGTDGFAANDSAQVTLNSCNVLTGTFTIDKNAPASATNFQSIGSAVAAMTSCGISGPVIFNVVANSGPYTEQVEITPVMGASAVNTITFNGNADTIQANPATGARHIIKLNGADHVTINNFTLLTTGTSTSAFGWGIHLLNGADHNTISNNIISIGSTSTTSGNSGGIIFSNATSSTTTTGNNGNSNIISGNTINGGYKGIALYGQATSAGNNQVLNNTIRNFYASGIELGSVNGTLVEGNDISRPTRSTVGTFEGINLNGSTKSSLIRKNRIHTSNGAATGGTVYGFYSNSNDAPVGAENIVTNNLVYNIGTTSTIYGIHNVGSNGIFYYHNTFNLDNTANTGTVRGFNQTTAANNIRFKNNIVNIVSGASGAKNAIYFATLTSPTIAADIESNNNVLHVTGGATASSGIGYYSSNRVTLADWRTASGDDTSSVSVDPAFTSISTGNFLPTTTAVNNIGVPVLPAVTHDITNALRNPLTPDPGAYEIGAFTPASNDSGVRAITAPNSGCNLSNQEVITITVNNFGTAALSNIPVSYAINGGTPVTAVVSGPIAPGASVTYSFTATANLSTPGSYSLVASTNLTADAVAANNAFTKVVVSSTAAAVPTITAGGATTFCAGGSVTLTAASTTTGATYTWFKDGVAITGATSATYSATTSGAYTAVATANNCPSAASAATTVTVNAAPAIPTITAGGPVAFCAGGSVTLTAASTTTGATFQWFNNGTAITGATSATYSANASGSYTVTATAGGCSATSVATVVTANPIATAPAITAGGATTVCAGGSVVLTAASSTTGATYSWFKDGVAITGATGATYSATTAGNYTAVATANGCPSAASAATAVTVNPAPAVPTLTAGGATTFCDGGSVTLTAASATTGATFTWFKDGVAITGATSATYSASTSGNYTATATAGGCSSTSTATAVTVTALPATPTVTRAGFTLTSSSATGNQWYKDSNLITGATAATYTATANGNYTVIVTANGCASAVSNPVSILNTGINEAETRLELSVYPNPSAGLFNLAFPENQVYELVVTDLAGKVIRKQVATGGANQLNLQGTAKGVYLLQLLSEGKTATRKLVIQ